MDLTLCSRLATCLISRTVGKKQDLLFEIEEAIVSRQNVIFHIGIWPAQWVLYSTTLPKSIFCSLMTTSSQKVGFMSYLKLGSKLIWALIQNTTIFPKVSHDTDVLVRNHPELQRLIIIIIIIIDVILPNIQPWK